MASKDDDFTVAALDFGTTYSGYAFSRRVEFETTPLKIYSNQPWNSGGKELYSMKTPTCLLLNHNKEFVSFGYDAENIYAELVDDEKQNEYYYFHRFKMNLHNNKAGIPSDRLLLALEPEAASIFCQYLPTEQLHGIEKGFTMANSETKYMVVDLGGGTTDITVHMKLENGYLKELCKASGNDCGGTSVDGRFFQMLVKLFGGPFMKKLKEENQSAYLDLFREFETVKRTIYPSRSSTCTITIPYATLDQICKDILGEDIVNVVGSSALSDKLTLIYDKLRVDADLMKSFFTPTIDDIIMLMKNIIKSKSANDVSHILLVGGFAECKLIQEAVATAFPGIRIIIPNDAGLSVLKGAVLFGHQPHYVQERVLRYTYGVLTTKEFDYQKHDRQYLYLLNGIERCDFLFDIIVKAGKVVKAGTVFTNDYGTTKDFQSTIIIALYVSTEDNPVYTVEESCTLIGKLKIDLPAPCKETRWVDAEFMFGNTELDVLATDRNSGKQVTAHFELL